MSGCIVPEIDDERAKQLLINHYAKQSKSSLSSDARKQHTLNKHLRIINKERFDAVLYSLKTILKKVEDTEIYIDLTTRIRPQISNDESDSISHKECHQCNGKKIIKCITCKNLYSLNCHFCDNDFLQPCNHCHNSTFTYNDKCKTCHNKRFVLCDLCKGCGEIICYKGRQTVTEPIEDFIISCKDSSIPFMVLCKSKGTVLVNQTKKRLEAINHYPDDTVHKNCKDLLKRHEMKLRHSPSWDLVNQNHKLVAIPIVSYTALCKEKQVKFMLIGENLDVYIPKPPRSPCSIS